MRRLVAALWLLISAGVAGAQWGGPTTLKFEFQRDGMPGYVLTVTSIGQNTYAFGEGVSSAGSEAPRFHPFPLNGPSFRTLEGQAKSLGSLPGGCGTRLKNIARTGQKTLTFTAAGATAVPEFRCTWDYSDNTTVTLLGEEFTGLALTLQAGEKLAQEQRFDRLGLDHEMSLLLDEVKAGQAWGIEAIAPVLHKIVDDQSLLERVRAKAQKLLEQGAPENSPPAR